jgi:hypothetical protein
LNSPPLILKKTHALTASENPKLKEMYNNCAGSLTVPTLFVISGAWDSKATWVPENAKNRNNTVPANSAMVATKWFLIWELS